jgi:hypothetical protein
MRTQSQTRRVYAEPGIYISDDLHAEPVAVNYRRSGRSRIATSPHLLVVTLGGARDDSEDWPLEVAVEVHDRSPPVDSGGWEHIAEASIHLTSGRLSVSTIEDRLAFEVEPGWYRVRPYQARMTTHDEPVPYRLELWPAPFAPTARLGPGRP